MPGDDDLPDEPAVPTAPGPEDPEPSHRGEALSLGARLAAARVKIAVAVGVLVLGVAGLATGVGPGDGWFGADDATAPTTGRSPELPEAPEATGSAEPTTSGSTLGLSYAGLCRAYREALTTNADAAAEPEYAALVDDAGGRAKVSEYCEKLLGEPLTDATATPTAPPTDQPTSAPPGSSSPTRTPRPTSTANPTPQPTPTATPTDPGPTPTATPTGPPGPGGKPTKTPKP